jgi:hypothetical protein
MKNPNSETRIPETQHVHAGLHDECPNEEWQPFHRLRFRSADQPNVVQNLVGVENARATSNRAGLRGSDSLGEWPQQNGRRREACLGN